MGAAAACPQRGLREEADPRGGCAHLGSRYTAASDSGGMDAAGAGRRSAGRGLGVGKRGLVRLPLHGGGISQGEEDGLSNRGFAVSHRESIAADDRVAVGDRGDAAELALGLPSPGGRQAKSHGGGGSDLRGNAAELALQAAAWGVDGEGILLCVGAPGRAHEPQDRRPARLAGVMARLDEVTLDGHRRGKLAAATKKSWGNLRANALGFPTILLPKARWANGL